jgi:DNA-binding LacI/PurR family transcriptional regulator
VDGLLLTTRRKTIFGIRIYELLQEKSIPSVLLHDVYDSKLPIVDVDNFRGGQLAAEHLLTRVKRNFAVIVGENGFRPDDMRLEGFLSTLKEHGVDVDSRCFVFRYSFGTENTAFDEGYKIGKALALKNLDIDGIFLFNDLIAMGFQKAVIERGYRIPEDIAVIGFDNIERCSEARVPLTTIEVPRYEIGSLAFRTLVDIIENRAPQKPVRTLLEPRLIVRESA